MPKSKYVHICPNCGTIDPDGNADYIFKDGAGCWECAHCGQYAISSPKILRSNVKRFKNDEKYRKAIQAKIKAKDKPHYEILKKSNRKLLGFVCIIIGMILFLFLRLAADLFRLLVVLIASFLAIAVGIILLIKSYKK